MAEVTDTLRVDPQIPGQRYAVISIVEPRNQPLMVRREAFIASRFIAHFLTERTRADEWMEEEKKSQDDLSDVTKRLYDTSDENIKNLYLEFFRLNGSSLLDDFNIQDNPKHQLVLSGIKIRKVCATEEEARAAAKDFHHLEPAVHVYVTEVGRWVPYIPFADAKIDTEYAREQLNELMNYQHKSMEYKKSLFEERTMNAI